MSERVVIDPAIIAVLRHLPADGRSVAAPRLAAICKAFAAVIDIVYPEEHETPAADQSDRG